jgi:AraC family transcriptional regulator
MKPHWQQQHIIAITINGSGWLEQTVDGRVQKEYPAPGDIGIYPACRPHQIRWQKDAEFIFLCLEPALLEHFAAQAEIDRSVELIPQLKVQDFFLQQIGLTLKKEMESIEPSDSQYFESLKTTLILHLLKYYSGLNLKSESVESAGLSRYQLQQVVDYIHDCLDAELSVKEMAQTVGLSQYHFSRMFKQSTGMAPHQYVMQQRLELAKQLLKQPELPMSDIAYQCGFANQSHLSKSFRNNFGISPKFYRTLGWLTS